MTEPNFVYGFTFAEDKDPDTGKLVLPAKFYVHREGWREVYGGNFSKVEDMLRSYRETELDRFTERNHFDWMIGFVWADEGGSRRVDAIGYRLDPKDPSFCQNPEVYAECQSLDSREEGEAGVTLPSNFHEHALICGDGLIVLGKEEELRRELGCLESYMGLDTRFSFKPEFMAREWIWATS